MHNDRVDYTLCNMGATMLDALDDKLLVLLERNARASVATIAAQMGVSRATIKARIDKLIKRNIIEGFTIIKGIETRQSTVRAMVQIEVKGIYADQVAAVLKKFDAVRELYSTNGRWDFIAQIEVIDLPSFDEVLRRIRLIEGISLTESNILLSKK